MPWTVLLAILRPLANSLTPKPSLDEAMALRIAKAFFTEGAPYPFIIVHHNKLFYKVTIRCWCLSTSFRSGFSNATSLGYIALKGRDILLDKPLKYAMLTQVNSSE
jgi:hypothetical protein